MPAECCVSPLTSGLTCSYWIVFSIARRAGCILDLISKLQTYFLCRLPRQPQLDVKASTQRQQVMKAVSRPVVQHGAGRRRLLSASAQLLWVALG